MFCSMWEGNVLYIEDDNITSDLDVDDLEFSNSWIERADFFLDSSVLCGLWICRSKFWQQFQNYSLKSWKPYFVETMIEHVTILNLLDIP